MGVPNGEFVYTFGLVGTELGLKRAGCGPLPYNNMHIADVGVLDIGARTIVLEDPPYKDAAREVSI
jgi:hypothetical protein